MFCDLYINDINSDGNTTLLIAVKVGSLKCVEVLLRYGANVNLTDDNEFTTLMLDCANDHAKVVKILLEKNVITDMKKNEGLTALDIAKRYNLRTCVNMFNEYEYTPCE